MKILKREAKKVIEINNNEKEAEDWCFICKDGGNLMICDYKDCVKVYHPRCVGKRKSFMDTGKRWICRKHYCSLCLSTPRFCCFLCPNSMCRNCISGSEFTVVRGKRGFCKSCLKLVLLAEENSEYGLDGEKIDFNDRDTFECLFKEYWEIIKQKEGLTLDDVYSADVQLKKRENHKYWFDSVLTSASEEVIDITTSDSGIDNREFQRSMGKRKAQEFLGWGSKPLIEFLTSIGKDTTKRLSQLDLDSIINGYIRERNLFHPEKKKKVLCDDKLYSIFKRKSVNWLEIYGLLGTHINENMVSSDENRCEDEDKGKAEDKKNDAEIPSKKRAVSLDITTLEKEASFGVRQSGFASIVVNNIKLVYLRGTLVKELLKQPENSESKVLGSFVRVKNDPRDHLQRNSHRILQVEGIKKNSTTNEMDGEIMLQVSNITSDIPLAKLSDCDFTEEECEELRQSITNGRLRKPTIADLEQKARDLHEDITKHWINRELVRLQHCIDRANEKGRRSLCSTKIEYLDQREELQRPFVQEQLLQKVPKVIPEFLEDDFGPADSIEFVKK